MKERNLLPMLRVWVYGTLIIGGLIMFRTLARPTQELVPEDGTVSAALLPLDLETSKIDYETATFGLG